jgi:arylsulfatase A-like enzyme
LLIDLAPTFTELAGLGSPEGIDGVSFLPLLFGDSEGWRDKFIFERWQGDEPVLTKGIVTTEWKLIVLPNGDLVLFDRVNDPYELTNLADEEAYAGLIAELLEQLDEVWDGK